MMQRVKARLGEDPLDRSANPRRVHRLRGMLGTKMIAGRVFDQWQFELSSAGRIWYCPDREDRIVWVTRVSLRHPRETE